MMTDSERQFSELTSSALSYIGYSWEQIKIDALQNSFLLSKYFIVEKTLAGSKGEGIAKAMAASDTDELTILTDIVCVEEGCSETGVSVFEIDDTNNAPGYIKLKLIYLDGEFIAELLLMACTFKDPFSETVFLSHGRIQSFLEAVHKEINEGNQEMYSHSWFVKNGPAFTKNTSTHLQSMLGIKTTPSIKVVDKVFALHVYSPQILKPWAGRRRFGDWPSQSALNEGLEMEVLVVPIGSKETYDQEFEWRICCTRTELFLTSSLNDTQMKVYVLLKMLKVKIAEDKISTNVTSYMMKNIVYWICEGMFIRLFSPDQLVRQFLAAIRLFKNCLVNNSLPYYMIPDRNLLSGKIEAYERKKLIIYLNSLLMEGPTVILRLEKLSNAMVMIYKQPSQTTEDDQIRHAYIERLFFYFIFRLMHALQTNGYTVRIQQFSDLVDKIACIQSDLGVQNILCHMLYLVNPEWYLSIESFFETLRKIEEILS